MFGKLSVLSNRSLAVCCLKVIFHNSLKKLLMPRWDNLLLNKKWQSFCFETWNNLPSLHPMLYLYYCLRISESSLWNFSVKAFHIFICSLLRNLGHHEGLTYECHFKNCNIIMDAYQKLGSVLRNSLENKSINCNSL